ncbi:Iojap family protein [Criblamydia sequanensis CRIB-18]|uniref:Ribosomal silencing factor RsfS n=2 Tax=Candidatus Criblamydia sequanensis TaxID=340071 RepID=A0A090CYG3_9BACT|nr:Iojap family protein [Criblamydia sequanensis CRIB-18]
MMKSEELLNLIAQALFDKKGFNILALDVRGISSMTDYLLIAEGSVDRHVKALLKTVEEATLQFGIKPLLIEGNHTGDWCVIDYGEVMVHIFQPELREHYSLEELWKMGKIVNLKLDITNSEVLHGK